MSHYKSAAILGSEPHDGGNLNTIGKLYNPLRFIRPMKFRGARACATEVTGEAQKTVKSCKKLEQIYKCC
jgi:hypothetical protein